MSDNRGRHKGDTISDENTIPADGFRGFVEQMDKLPRRKSMPLSEWLGREPTHDEVALTAVLNERQALLERVRAKREAIKGVLTETAGSIAFYGEAVMYNMGDIGFDADRILAIIEDAIRGETDDG